MTTARTILREKKKRDIRTAKAGNANNAIGVLTPGCEIFILTFGQFSLLDAISTILDQTGPADVAISTWTAATADLQRSAAILKRGGIRSLRMIVDRSFLTRQPDYCATMRALFGDESIRTARLHSKFATITNDDWTIAIRTSMNLNENPRLENLEISDDPDPIRPVAIGGGAVSAVLSDGSSPSKILIC